MTGIFIYRFKNLIGGKVNRAVKAATLLGLCLLVGSVLYAQSDSRIITGKVTDGQGEPLIGVTVSIPGGVAGTVSDSLGNYTLEIGKTVSTLRFSAMGYV